MKMLERLNNKYKIKVTDKYLHEFAELIVDLAVKPEDYKRIFDELIIKYNTFPSLKEAYESIINYVPKPKSEIRPEVFCIECSGQGFVICQDLKGRKGPAACMCEAGQWLLRQEPRFYTTSQVKKYGGIVGVVL